MQPRQRCVVASRHGASPPLAAPGLMVCRGHASKISDMLTDVDELVGDLLAAHNMGEGGLTDKVDHTSDPGLRFRAEVADAGERLYRTLHRWAHAVTTERGFTHPAPSLTAFVQVLTTNLDWLLARAEVEAFHDELEADRLNARSLAFPSGRRRIEINLPDGTPARCLDNTSCDVTTRREQRCPGRLTAVVAPIDDLLPSWIECDTCEVRVSSAQWLAYGRRLHRAAS